MSRVDVHKIIDLHVAGCLELKDVVDTLEYIVELEGKIKQLQKSSNSDYAKFAEEIQEMCENGSSQSDIIDYLCKHFA
jgi:hypothetical protein